jgi:uncharacterized protein (TIGR03067 family)
MPALLLMAVVAAEYAATTRTDLIAAGYTRVVALGQVLPGRLDVSGEVNGRRVRLMIDTGAVTGIYLDKRLADELRLPTRANDGRRMFGVGGGITPVATTTVREMRIGSLALGTVAADVVNTVGTPELKATMERYGWEFDGIIGGLMLEQLSAVIDYPNRSLYLAQPWALEPDLLGDWTAVGCERDGRPIPPDQLGWRFVIDKDSLTYFRVDGTKVRFAVRLTPGWRPKRGVVSHDGRTTTPFLYRLDGRDTLVMAMAMNPDDDLVNMPAGFFTTPASRYAVMTFRRTKLE